MRERSDTQLKQLAVDYTQNLVYGSWDIQGGPTEWALCFMPLALIDEPGLKQLIEKNIAHVYEYLKRAGPTSVNGMPVFTSMRLMNVDDFRYFKKCVATIVEASTKALEKL